MDGGAEAQKGKACDELRLSKSDYIVLLAWNILQVKIYCNFNNNPISIVISHFKFKLNRF